MSGNSKDEECLRKLFFPVSPGTEREGGKEKINFVNDTREELLLVERKTAGVLQVVIAALHSSRKQHNCTCSIFLVVFFLFFFLNADILVFFPFRLFLDAWKIRKSIDFLENTFLKWPFSRIKIMFVV